MSWITTTDETEATGLLKEVYEGVKEQRGKVSNVMKAQSLNPHALEAHLDLYMTLMFGKSGLTRQERELIAVAVSAANGCEYCENHHAEALNQYWNDDEKVRKFRQQPQSLELPQRMLRMVEYAVKLTKNPKEIDRADIDALRESGFSDEDILNIDLITSYFNFVNRIALGLGVEFTPEEMQGYKG